jgi:FixJ family two-component response regulator
VYWPTLTPQSASVAEEPRYVTPIVPLPVPPDVAVMVAWTLPAETLVVVDDEDAVCRMVAQLMQRAGYRVLTALSGADALTLIRREHADVAALITDVRVPDMTGVELVSELLHDGIDLPVLLMSGQLDTPLPASWPDTAPRRFLGRPFNGATLLGAVHALLQIARNA